MFNPITIIKNSNKYGSSKPSNQTPITTPPDNYIQLPNGQFVSPEQHQQLMMMLSPR